MSRILADKVTNYNNDGPFEAEKGINIPLARPLQISGNSGISGQYLSSTGIGLTWETLPELFSGDYNDLANKPVLFSGSYNNLTDKPAILNINLGVPVNNQYLKFNGTQWINADLPPIYEYTISTSYNAGNGVVGVVLEDQFFSQSAFGMRGDNGIELSTDVNGNIVITSPVVSEYDPDTAKDDVSDMFVNGTNTGITYTYNPITKTIDSAVSLAEQLVYTLYGTSEFPNTAKIYLDNGTVESGSVNIVGTNGIDISWDIGTSTISFSKTDPAPYVLPAATTTTLGGVIPDASDFSIDGLGNLTVNFPPSGVTLNDFSVTAEPAPSGNGSLSYDNTTGQFTYTPPLFSLDDLDGVGIAGATENQVLRFNGTNWTNSDIVIPSTLNDLIDVNASSPIEGDVIQYNGVSWSSEPINYASVSIEDLGNVSLRVDDDPNQILVWRGSAWDPVDARIAELDISQPPIGGQTIVWNETTNLWDPTTVNVGVSNLSDLDDVSTAAPTNGYVLTWNSNNLEWEPAAAGASPGAGLTSRVILANQTQSIADGVSDNVDIFGYKSYSLFKIETSAAAWVTVYTDATSRTNDASRPETTDPTPGSGVIAEVITTGSQTVLMTPAVVGFNNDLTPGSTIYLKVVNKSGVTQEITVSLTVLQLEA